MSTLGTLFGDTGASLDRTLRDHVDGIADARARLADQQNQLGVMNVSLGAVRQEVLERLDALEVTVLTKFEQLQAQLQSIAMALNNGSGAGRG